MPAKAPIYLKQGGKNGTGAGKNGKKLREILSTEMISPPLGDFRHMAHVGRGGETDSFGDTAFLQQKSAVSRRNGSTSHSQGIPAFHSFRRRGTGKSSKKMRNSSVTDNGNSIDDGTLFNSCQDGRTPLQSPILQSAFSLPLLNHQSSSESSPAHNGSNGKTENNNSIPVVDRSEQKTANPSQLIRPHPSSNGHVETKSNGISASHPEKQLGSKFNDTTSIDEAWALELDLGTSLMDDVIGIMDKIEL